MTVIAFFSNEYELNILKKRSDFNYIKLIALTPEADFSLINIPKKRNTIEDYYSEKELNFVGNHSLDKVNEICQSIDSEYFYDNKWFSCSDLYMFFKVLYDQLLINHTFCHSILLKEKPSKVFIFNKKKLSHDFICDSYDDLLLNFIDYFFRSHNIIVDNIFYEKKEDISRDNFFKIKKNQIKNFLSGLKFELLCAMYRFKNKQKDAICIIQHYDFFACMELRKYFKVFYIRDKKYLINEKINSTDFESLKKLFVFGGINYFNLIKIKIEYLINHLSIIISNRVENYSKWMVKKDIKAVIAASGQSLYILCAIKAAKLNEIPVIWGQHGGFYGYTDFPILKYIKKNYSHYFLYSEDCFSVNEYVRCFSVSNKKLQLLYKKKRLVE